MGFHGSQDAQAPPNSTKTQEYTLNGQGKDGEDENPWLQNAVLLDEVGKSTLSRVKNEVQFFDLFLTHHCSKSCRVVPGCIGAQWSAGKPKHAWIISVFAANNLKGNLEYLFGVVIARWQPKD